MYYPNIFGSFDTRDLHRPNMLTPENEALIMADLRKWSAFYERVAARYTSLLARTTTDAQGVYGASQAGGEMQPYTEYGNTEATNRDETGWAWGAPINRWRGRKMYTEEYLVDATLAQLQLDVIQETNANLATRMKLILRTIFNNTTRLYTARKGFPEIQNAVYNVYPLFNNDDRAGSMVINDGLPVAVGTMQSYLPSGAGTIAKAQLALARASLKARGLLGRVVHIISRADVETVSGFAGFIPTPTQESAYARTTPAPTETTAIVTMPESIGTFNDTGAATANGEVVAFPFWPQGYTMSLDVTAPVPVVIRNHPNPAYQGLKLRQDETKAPYGENSIRNKRWEYIAGAAVENQANGIVVKATAGAYSVPSLSLPLST